ncbi:MAG: hypothetical protein RI601_09870 [Desulfurivibrionaceae bacterium]|nr:hypothetical protein [Desulfurivibrionaceae bacterium]
MSKLYDTLEKIQEQETDTTPAHKAFRPPPAPRTRRFVPLLLGVLVVIALVVVASYTLPLFNKDVSRQQKKAEVSRPAEQQAVSSRVSRPAPQEAEDEKRPGPAQGEYFNNHAVSLNAQGQPWTALYYLDKASRAAPERPEPLINMALILTQMDLGFPAGRLFKKAHQLDPDNAYLRQAMELAIAKQVLPLDFYETMPVPARKGT